MHGNSRLGILLCSPGNLNKILLHGAINTTVQWVRPLVVQVHLLFLSRANAFTDDTLLMFL